MRRPGSPAARVAGTARHATLGSQKRQDLPAAFTSVHGQGLAVDPGHLVAPGSTPVPGSPATVPGPVLRRVPVPGPVLGPSSVPGPVPGPVPILGPVPRLIPVPGLEQPVHANIELPIPDLDAFPDPREELLSVPLPRTSSPLDARSSTPLSTPPLEDSGDETTTELYAPPSISESSRAPTIFSQPRTAQSRPIRKKRLPLKFMDYILAVGNGSLDSGSEFSDNN